jgi:hypothetical protein
MTNRDPAVAGQSDCVDSNRDIHPGAIELCDGIDNDCNGTDDAMRVHCYADMDDDTYAPAGTAASMQCPDAARMSVAFCPGRFTDRAPISVATSDCADANASVNPSITEMCQVPAFDQNCNGNADEGYVVCFLDADGDGFAATGAMTLASACPLMGGYGGCGTGYTSRNPATAGNADCADADAARNPLASELCSTTYDDDCDGMANEAPVLRNLYIDRDGDGYAGGPAMPMLLTCCTSTCVPAGYRTTGNDCNDRDAVVHPGVSTYYTTPYARCADASAFRCMPTTTWRCSADSTCDDSDPAAPMSFDYDCSGGEDAQPFADGMACTGSCFVNTPRVCRDSISSTQPCYSGVFPGCGGSTPTCRCDTSDGSLCTSAAECPGSYTAGLYNMQLGCR